MPVLEVKGVILIDAYGDRYLMRMGDGSATGRLIMDKLGPT